MRSFVSHLVAACLALHTLLGCCMHHAHAEHAHLGTICESCDHAGHDDRAHDEHADYDAEAGCGHDHDDEHATSATESLSATKGHDEPAAPCSGSCGEKCQFVTTGRVQLENPVVVPDLVPTASALVDLAAELPWVRSEAWLVAPPPALPLRLHLWNGLLLI